MTFYVYADLFDEDLDMGDTSFGDYLTEMVTTGSYRKVDVDDESDGA